MLPDAAPWERVHHVALRVDDLRAAEECYVDVFDMDVHLREVWHEADEEIEQVPPEHSWAETAAMGDELVMSFVGRGGIVLALHEPESPVEADGPVDHLNVRVEATELDTIEDRALDRGCELTARDEPTYTYVHDPFGVVWELKAVR